MTHSPVDRSTHRAPSRRARFPLLCAATLLSSACGSESDGVSGPDRCAGDNCSAGTGGADATGGGATDGTGGPGTGGGPGAASGGTASSGGTGSVLFGEVTIEEATTGQCGVDGAVESTHAGFSGAGYLNTDNRTGASIQWAIEIGEAGTYTFEFAYASEPAGDRPGDLVVDGVVAAAGVSFPSTSSWTTYTSSSTAVSLSAGQHSVELRATAESGLANIDSMTVTGAAVGASNCGGDPGTGGSGTGGQGTGGQGTGGQGTGGSEGDRCDIGVWDGSPPEILSLSGSLGTHDPAVVEANGVFYRFDTGYLIPSFSSNNLTHWTNEGGVYSNASYPPSWLADFRNDHSWSTGDNRDPWAPDVIYFGGKYHLYSSNSLFFGNNISCISHLTTTDLSSGNWVDEGAVVCTNGSENFNAIDPEVELDENGTPWMAFGSFWSAAIQAIELDQNGNRVGNDFHHLAHASSIEGPTLVRRCGYYYLFVTHGLCCPNDTEPARSINNIDYRTVVGRSTSILGPYVDKNGTPLTQGGGTIMVQGQNSSGVPSDYAAAGHGDVFIAGDKFYHAYHAYPYSRSPYAELRIVEMPFDDDGWPVPAVTP